MILFVSYYCIIFAKNNIFSMILNNKIISVIILTFFICSCSTKYIPVEVEKVKKEYITTFQVDTCYVKDSIFIKEKNDTVYLEKYRYLYKNKVSTDTLIVSDTIPIVEKVEVVKEVNKLKNWQKLLMVSGIIFIAYILYKLRNILNKNG